MQASAELQAELDHLVRLSALHPNWAEYATWKAGDLALRMPNRWGWLPEALRDSLKRQSAESKAQPNLQRGAA